MGWWIWWSGQNQHQQVIMALFKVPLLLCLFTVVISASVVPGNQEQNLAENEKNLPENVQNGPESLDFNLLSGGPRESKRTKTNKNKKNNAKKNKRKKGKRKNRTQNKKQSGKKNKRTRKAKNWAEGRKEQKA